jgi:hypothetical protein
MRRLMGVFACVAVALALGCSENPLESDGAIGEDANAIRDCNQLCDKLVGCGFEALDPTFCPLQCVLSGTNAAWSCVEANSCEALVAGACG